MVSGQIEKARREGAPSPCGASEVAAGVERSTRSPRVVPREPRYAYEPALRDVLQAGRGAPPRGATALWTGRSRT